MPTLNPCKCGDTPVVSRTPAVWGFDTIMIRCPKCGSLVGGTVDHEEGLVRLWNEANKG
jgi:hypothetical protein